MTSFLTSSFLLSTLRDWLVRLEAIAQQKPILFERGIRNNMLKSHIVYATLLHKDITMCMLYISMVSMRMVCGIIILPVKRGLGEGCQCHSTYNWYKGRNYPETGPLSDQKVKNSKNNQDNIQHFTNIINRSLQFVASLHFVIYSKFTKQQLCVSLFGGKFIYVINL